MTVSAANDETKVGMARCAVPAAFSGGILRVEGHKSIARPVPRLHGAGTPQRGIPTSVSMCNVLS
jgi:hypothetical protein